MSSLSATPAGPDFLFGHPMSADQSLAFIAQNLAEREETATAA